MYCDMQRRSVPDRGCVAMGSYHTGPQLHPCQCPSGQCCIRMGSYHPHLGFLCKKSSWLEFTQYIYWLPAPNRIIIVLNCPVWVSLFYHLHQCPPHRHLLLRCGRCQFVQGCVRTDSCRSDRQLHPCQNRTGEDCRAGHSCPVVWKERDC